MLDMRMPKYFFSTALKKYEEIFEKYGIRCEFSKNDIISSQGETLKNAFYIKKGVMQVSIGHEVGKEKIVCFIGEGSLFPVGVSEHRYKMEYSMVEKAFTDVEAYKLEYSQIREIVSKNPSIALDIIEDNCDFTSFLFYEIASLSYDRIKYKVSNIIYLLVSNGLFKENIIELNQEEIANLIGASRIQVARVLQFLRESKVIKTNRNSIKVIDMKKLSGLCSKDVLKSN